MNDFKLGDRFSVEGVVTALADSEGDYRALFDGHETDGYVIGAEMAHAKLIQPKPRYDWSNIPLEYDWAATDRGGTVYAYKNRPVHDAVRDYWYAGKFTAYIRPGSFTADWRDSLEQRPEEVEAAVKVADEKVLDLSKPIQLKDTKSPVNYLAKDHMDIIFVQEVGSLKVLGLDEYDLENIPEPKITTSDVLSLWEFKTGGRAFLWGDAAGCATRLSRVRASYTDGEGWSIEEVK